jgi:hypothetical protein
MKKLVAFIAAVLCVASCYADVQERVIDLPQDQGKWYISVVGDQESVRFAEVLGWFDSDINLSMLKDQVRFCRVTTGTGIYNERYASNVCGLPTVRVQMSDGTVMYEAFGDGIPDSSAELYNDIVKSVNDTMCIFRRRCNPCPQPQPVPEPEPYVPVFPDPEPQPIIDDPPDIVNDNSMPTVAAAVIALSFVLGVVAGIAVQWRKTHSK